MTKKTYVFISHFKPTSYLFKNQHFTFDFALNLSPKKAPLRVHYRKLYITINQSITKTIEMPKNAFLQINAENSPFYPLFEADIYPKTQAVIVSGFDTLVSTAETKVSAVGTLVSRVETKVSSGETFVSSA